MTIPQGELRGTQSVSERRKVVTFAGDTSSAGTPPPKPSTPSSMLAEEKESSASANAETCIKEQRSVSTNQEKGISWKDQEQSSVPITKTEPCIRNKKEQEERQLFLISEGGLSPVREERTDKLEKEIRNQTLYDQDQLEVNVTVVVPSEEDKKSPLPLLNFLKSGDAADVSSDRSRKLSLNLSKFSPKHSSASSHSSGRIRRYSQPPKSSYYQRIPLEDPSPPSPTPQIFTLQEFGQNDPGFKSNQNLSTHSAEVHAPFNERDKTKVKAKDNPHCDATSGASCTITSVSRDNKKPKRVLFSRQGTLTRSKSSSSKSLDDLSVVHHGGASGKPKSLSTNRSVSSEDLTNSSKKRLGASGGANGGNHPRRLAGDPQASPGSPSRCCLVSVSRVPMAAATSHLTLDSDYQTVRLAVLGAPGVGKSSIVRQFVMQQFMEEYVPTEQRQVFCPAVIINEHLYEVRIIDCPYIPYFPVNSLYEWTDFRGYGLRNATAYVLVYDITSEESFEYIKSLRLQILESRNKHDVPIFVVGNKHDLAEERGVPRREVREIANLVKKQWKCGYIECSAKYNWHIMLLFKELMKTVDYIDYGHKPTSMRVQDALRRNRCLIL